MFPTPVARLSIFALMITGAVLTHPRDAKANGIDPVKSGHDVVYIDESGKAYSLDGQHKHKGKDGKWHLDPVPINFTKVDGVPTATEQSKFDQHMVIPGSILLKDSGTGSSDSDLIVFTMPTDKKEKQKLLFCSDDSKENPPEDPKGDGWADVGLSKCKSQDPVKTFTEEDLSNYTVEVQYKGDTFDSEINLKGKFGYIYIANFGDVGADKLAGEDPILYVFVSDSCSEGTGKSLSSTCAPPVPEPPSLLLLGPSLFGLAGLPMMFRWSRRKLTE